MEHEENEHGLTLDQMQKIQALYIDRVNEDRQMFYGEVSRIVEQHLLPAIERATVDVNPMPTALLHAIFLAAFKTCRKVADKEFAPPPDYTIQDLAAPDRASTRSSTQWRIQHST
jgi:hypothetical protein